MTVGEISGLIAAIAFAILVLFAAYLLYQLVKTMGIVNSFIDETRRETIPLMTRLQTTMDHLNTELERVDGILTAAKSMSDKVNSMTKVAQELVTSPLVKMTSLLRGFAKTTKKWRE